MGVGRSLMHACKRSTHNALAESQKERGNLYDVELGDNMQYTMK
jgi:hypothetical protein